MASGMWTSAAGASAQAQHVDAIANNLANSDTLGFKKDMPTFKEYLSVLEREQSAKDIPRGPIKDKDFYPIDGKDQAFVVVDGTYTNFRPGTLKVTQNQLDVALDGPGFLEVSTPNGVRYTRQGSLKLAMDGRLVTSEGNPVLSQEAGGLAAQAAPGAKNEVDAARFINLRDKAGPLSITEKGEIYAGESLVAKLSLAEFTDPRKLRKSGSAMFESMDPANRAEPQKTVVRQGMLETSNVNPIEEMTNLIKANRLFEHDMKAMRTYGEMMQKESSDIGKL